MTHSILKSLSIGLALIITLACPARGSAQDASEGIFLPLKEKSEGAPSKKGLKRTVVLTDIRSQSPWFGAVKVLKKAGFKEVISVVPWNANTAFKKLKGIKPGAVICVFRPKTIDVNFHFDFLERASRLDKDPFVDFTFGYVTGGTPKEAERFASNICKARKRQFKSEILLFGPSSKPTPVGGLFKHNWAKGFQTKRWAHKEGADNVATKLNELKPEGIVSTWGHGMPDGVDGGMKGKELFETKGLNLSKTLYFSGPCYCGVPAGWFDNDKGKVKRVSVAPEESFLLGLIRARVSAVFAGLDPDRGETNHHEREHVILGKTLGEASKATYDDVVIALAKPELKLFRYEEGKRPPRTSMLEDMTFGGACRALFGLPTLRPYRSDHQGPFAIKPKATKNGLAINWTNEGRLGPYWLPVDVFHSDGGYTYRLRFHSEIPLKIAKKLKALKVLEVSRDGKALNYSAAKGAVEVYGGKAYLHATVAFPQDSNDRVLVNGKEFRARLLFTYK